MGGLQWAALSLSVWIGKREKIVMNESADKTARTLMPEVKMTSLYDVWEASQGLADYIQKNGDLNSDPQVIRAQIQLISARFEYSQVKG